MSTSPSIKHFPFQVAESQKLYTSAVLDHCLDESFFLNVAFQKPTLPLLIAFMLILLRNGETERAGARSRVG